MVKKNEKVKGHDEMERQNSKVAYVDVSNVFLINILPTLIKTLTSTYTESRHKVSWLQTINSI